MEVPTRDHGLQPFDVLMDRWKLSNHQLVESSPEQLNHKQVQKARKGRQLTLHLMQKVTRSLNIAIWERLNQEQKEAFVEYLHRHFRGYFLQLILRGPRKDRDGWATASAALGDRIRAARLRLGATQAGLAARLGVTKGTLLTWEANRRRPGPSGMRKLAELLGADFLSRAAI